MVGDGHSAEKMKDGEEELGGERNEEGDECLK